MRFLSRLLVSAQCSLPPQLVLADGTTIAVTIRTSHRATRLALRFHPRMDGVELVVPQHVALNQAQSFLESRRLWISTQLQHVLARIPFTDGMIIPVLGTPKRLTHIAARDRSRRPFTITDDTIDVTGMPEYLSRRTMAGFRSLAATLLTEKTREIALKVARPVHKISIGDAYTRWGSCSRAGNISYSWRLILAPESVLDYVVAHEVAHLVELNHSARFWRLVAQLHPTFEIERAWLRQHAAQLHRYG